jgi:DNA-binding transcriptional ArsR family regulator
VVANEVRTAWEALGDPTRRAIVACLAERPRAVGEIADELPITRPAVSQHLKVLKDAGLVTDRAVGTRRVYRLNPAGVAALRDQLDTFWHRALDGYRDVAESGSAVGSTAVDSTAVDSTAGGSTTGRDTSGQDTSGQDAAGRQDIAGQPTEEIP